MRYWSIPRFETLLLTALGLPLAACSGPRVADEHPGGQVAPPAAVSPAAGPVTLAQLQAELARQLAAASPTAPRAPQGDSARPQLLLKHRYEAGAGAGEVLLEWGEALPGDYDGNGEVNAADLLPLARWLDPAAGGTWPPPQRGKADGNGDGVVTVQDVTTIARHFGERLDGYRVYRRTLGTSDWTLLPDPQAPAGPLSIPHSAAVVAVPPSDSDGYFLRYVYLDAPPAAQLEYYVAPVWLGGPAEGTPSDALAIEPTATFNDAPAPALTLPPVWLPGHAGQTLLRPGAPAAGYPLQIGYDLGADGSYETQFTQTNYADSLPRSLPAPPLGRQILRVRVTDQHGQSGFAQAAFTVNDANRPPVPVVEASFSGGSAPVSVRIRANDSYDPDGDACVLEYRQEGPEEQVSSLGLDSVLWTPGRYTFTLRVSDVHGAVGVWQQQLDVPQAPPPAAGWQFTDLPRELATDSFTLAAIGGRPALALRVNGLPGWRYYAALDSAGASWPAGTGSDLAPFGPPGGHFYDCRLLEAGGLPAAYLPCSGSEPEGGHYYCVAQGPDGAAWRAPQQLGGYHVWGAGSMGVAGGQPLLAFYEDDKLCVMAALDAQGLAWGPLQMLPGTAGPGASGMRSAVTELLGRPAVLLASNGDLTLWRASNAAGTQWDQPEPASIGLWPGIALGWRDNGSRFLAAAPGVPPLLYGGGTVGYAVQRALDSGAGLWRPSQAVPLPAEQPVHLRVALVGGRPCVAYGSRSGADLWYCEALDALGSAWSAPLLLDARGDCAYDLELAEIGGQPAVLYTVDEGPAVRGPGVPTGHASSVIDDFPPEAYVTLLRFARRLK